MADVKEFNINNTTYDIKAKSVVDTNSGDVKFWTGTQAEYDALPREWYAWYMPQISDIIYVKVPYDETIVNTPVYDSNFQLISYYDETTFFMSLGKKVLSVYDNRIETEFACREETSQDIMTGDAAKTIYICTDTQNIYLGTTPISNYINATVLNGKANINLTNVNDNGTSISAGWAFPSATNISITIGASDTSYTAPANGWFRIIGTTTVANGYVYYSGIGMYDICYAPPANYTVALTAPVKKGNSITIGYGGVNVTSIKFIYAVGSESEAS